MIHFKSNWLNMTGLFRYMSRPMIWNTKSGIKCAYQTKKSEIFVLKLIWKKTVSTWAFALLPTVMVNIVSLRKPRLTHETGLLFHLWKIIWTTSLDMGRSITNAEHPVGGTSIRSSEGEGIYSLPSPLILSFWGCILSAFTWAVSLLLSPQWSLRK